MKARKFSLIWSILLITTIAFGQKQSKKISESFKVNKDVLVEINSRNTNVTVETWNKNIVEIKGIWEMDGITKEEANQYFEGWEFEALGNKNKVVITSKSSNDHYFHSDVFDNFDFDFDFDYDLESISHFGEMFNGDYYSKLPSMPPMPAIKPMPPMSPLPPFPGLVIDHIRQIEFDYDAYMEDKESYMKKFEKQQQAWAKEFEDKFEPQMKAYQKQMEEWQKKIEPQMKVYKEKMKQWEKEVEPQMKEYERKMEKKLETIEKEMEEKYALKMKEKEDKMAMNNIKKSLTIKVPAGTTLKVNSRHGKLTIPNHIKTIN